MGCYESDQCEEKENYIEGFSNIRPGDVCIGIVRPVLVQIVIFCRFFYHVIMRENVRIIHCWNKFLFFVQNAFLPTTATTTTKHTPSERS